MPAYKIGLMGKPNSGKSYSRMSVDYKSSFVIMPDLSDPYLMKNETERVDQFNFLFEDKSYFNNQNGLIGNQASPLAIDHDNRLWIGISGGLMMLNQKRR